MERSCKISKHDEARMAGLLNEDYKDLNSSDQKIRQSAEHDLDTQVARFKSRLASHDSCARKLYQETMEILEFVDAPAARYIRKKVEPTHIEFHQI